jgi:hypothetical protein
MDKIFDSLDIDSDKEDIIRNLRQTINIVNEIVDWINEYDNNEDEIISTYMNNVKGFYKLRRRNWINE